MTDKNNNRKQRRYPVNPGLEKIAGFLKEYLAEISRLYGKRKRKPFVGTYYPALERLLLTTIEAMQTAPKKAPVEMITMPRKEATGMPNIYIGGKEDQGSVVYGHIDALAPGGDLHRIVRSYRFKRYGDVFKNVILTDLLEFRLYRFEKLTHRVTIGGIEMMEAGFKSPAGDIVESFYKLVELFFSYMLLWHQEGYCYLFPYLSGENKWRVSLSPAS